MDTNDIGDIQKKRFTRHTDEQVAGVHVNEPAIAPVEIGEVRDLKIDDELVFVGVTEDLGSGTFRGKSVSFDSSADGEYQGHRTGDTIYFKEMDIWF